METFIKYNILFQNLVSTSDDILNRFFNDITREEAIKWLSWNDKNGIYSDVNSLKEFGNTLTRKEAIEIMQKQIEENR